MAASFHAPTLKGSVLAPVPHRIHLWRRMKLSHSFTVKVSQSEMRGRTQVLYEQAGYREDVYSQPGYMAGTKIIFRTFSSVK